MSCEDSGHQIASRRVHTDFRWSPIEYADLFSVCAMPIPMATVCCVDCAHRRRRAAAAQSPAHATAT
eukprot:6667034-Prymnesium_polylepis.1